MPSEPTLPPAPAAAETTALLDAAIDAAALDYLDWYGGTGNAMKLREAINRQIRPAVAKLVEERNAAVSALAVERAHSADLHRMLREAREEVERVKESAGGLRLKLADAIDELEQFRDLSILRLARMTAANDQEKHEVQYWCDFIKPRISWRHGRIVISEELAAQIPCPYETGGVDGSLA